MNALVYVNIDRGIHKGKLKNALNEKRKNDSVDFLFITKNIANFEAFPWNIKLSACLLFLKSVVCEMFEANNLIFTTSYSYFSDAISTATKLLWWLAGPPAAAAAATTCHSHLWPRLWQPTTLLSEALPAASLLSTTATEAATATSTAKLHSSTSSSCGGDQIHVEETRSHGILTTS